VEEYVHARGGRIREDDRVQRGLGAEAPLGLRLGAQRLEAVQDRARVGAPAVDAEEDARPVRHQVLSASHDGDDPRRRPRALDGDQGHAHAVPLGRGQEREPHRGADPTLHEEAVARSRGQGLEPRARPGGGGIGRERIRARRDLEAVPFGRARLRDGAREEEQGEENRSAPHQK
jgi:hypothetical protein